MPTVDESIGGSIPLSGLLHELCASSPGDSVEVMARFRLTLFLSVSLPVSLFLPCFSWRVNYRRSTTGPLNRWSIADPVWLIQGLVEQGLELPKIHWIDG